MSGSWHRDAACVGVDLDVFFPPPPSYPSQPIYRGAGTYCGRCPVQRSCLEAALVEEAAMTASSRRWGMRGGLTPGQRERLAPRTSTKVA